MKTTSVKMVILSALMSSSLYAQSVVFRCTQVATNGDISLAWQALSIPTGYQYEVYATSNTATPFSILTTITNTAITTYTHTGAGGGISQWFYFIKACPQPPAAGTSYFSDTVGSILMVLSNLGDGFLSLYWTRPSSPPLPSQAQNFVVQRERNGVWSNWASTSDSLFVDTLKICGETLGYCVTLSDSSGCQSSSIQLSDLLTDVIAPQIPLLDTVAIDPSSGNTRLGWERSPDPDVLGYIVYIFQNGIWNKVDTVYGANNTFYVDTVNSANTEVQQYRICAIDTCRNASPLGDVHNTLLPQATPHKCDSLIILNWNAYASMPNGVSGYHIYVSVNGSPFVLLTSVNSTTLSYTHTGLDPINNYTYLIQAHNDTSSLTALSQKVAVAFNRVLGNGAVLMRYVSVVNNSDLEVVVFVHDTVNNTAMNLYMSSDGGNNFTLVDKKTKVIGNPNNIFTIANADVSTTIYYFYAAITDECQMEYARSDTANNIVLTSLDAPGDLIDLQWNHYWAWTNKLDAYDVFRQTQQQASLIYNTSVAPSTAVFQESVWSLANDGAKFLYQVVANEDNTNPFGFQDKSYSNIVEVNKSPETFVPNAFVPSSSIVGNEIFKPVNIFVDAKNYHFVIFDRTGQQIFETNDVNAGWDGTVKGEFCQMGVYMYHITYQVDEKTTFSKRGHVNLIR